ncbi:MAG TPA: apolipoprotein N-acyltransferase [Aliiroseovarius sp.]|nr:apolipoprotein N-acyltransferase [Aliiroseovarius sp.]
MPAASSACACVCPIHTVTESGSRKWRGIPLAFAAGAVAALGMAPFGLWGGGVAGLAAGFALIARAGTARGAGALGWALGTGYFMGSLNWLVSPFLVDAPRYGWMAPFALFFMAAGLALFWAVASWGAHRLVHGRASWLVWPVIWPVTMSLAELARGRVLTGFPWAGPGEFWVDTPLLGLAPWIGATGMGFLTFLFAAWLAHAIGTSRRARALAAWGVAAAVVLAFGVWQMSRPVPERAAPLAVRLVQPNAAQDKKWDPALINTFLRRAAELTAAPPAAGARAPDLVVWPETSVPYLLDDAGQILADIAEIAAPARVVLGIQRAEAGPRYFNSLVVLDRSGNVTALYDKYHLVPFGEYTPGGGLLYKLGIRGLAAQYGGGYSAGPGPRLLDLGAAGKVAPLICYEAIFPNHLRALPGRPDWILQITNDAWFGSFSGPQQHLAIARLRAAEFGLPFMRAANTGISAMIDPRGRIVASLALDTPGFLDVRLPGAASAPLYARFGDAVLMLLLLGCIAGQRLAWRRGARKGD